MSEVLARRVFVASIFLLVTVAAFAFGFASGKKKIWPYEPILEMKAVSDSLLKYRKIVPPGVLIKAPAGAPRQRLTIYRPDLMIDGYYVFLGWDDRRYSAWLYDKNGERLHTWTWDYENLDPDGPLHGSDMPHGFKVLSDGSAIVNFDLGDIMARLDSCGKPIWVKKGVYHHSIEAGEDGSFWTWRGEGSAYTLYQYLVNFDPGTGTTIKEIGLVEDVIKNMRPDLASVIFVVRPDYGFERNRGSDLFHPNDIDVLYSNLANKFPDFEAGDLLVSFRNLHLVAVLDPDDKHVKWWSHGPWRFQHDPDFTEDGKISVFNNNTGVGRSEIIKIDPKTRELSNDLVHGDVYFYSAGMGKHQYLPNGNVLLVVSTEGRVIEVSARGEKVLEFNNTAPGLQAYNGHTENALWVPTNFFDRIPSCSQGLR